MSSIPGRISAPNVCAKTSGKWTRSIMTHSHTDHIMGFDDLRRFAAPRGGRMPVYASAETMADLERVYEFAFKADEPLAWLFETGAAHYLRPVFVRQNHDHAPAGAARQARRLMVISSPATGKKLLAYLSDCSARAARRSRARSQGVAAARHRCASRQNRIPPISASPRPWKSRIGCNPARTLFTHICHELPQSAESESAAGVGIAYDGLKIDYPAMKRFALLRWSFSR